MPPKRQASSRPEAAIAVRSLGLRLPSGYSLAPHRHEWHQLEYATQGVMTLETPEGAWVVPPHRAVWVPAGLSHSVRTLGEVRMRTLYFRPASDDRMARTCCVISVTDLLRELILETMRLGMLRDDVPEQARLHAVLADQVLQTREAPLRIRHPSDPRARRVAEKARRDLSKPRPLSELVQGSGASVRTIERLFQLETGTTFGRWLQQAKALHAVERLAAGDSVTEAALATGYDSTSAFIAMFRRVLGTTPGAYFTRPQ